MPKQEKGSKQKQQHTGKFFIPGLRNVRSPPPAKPTNKPISLGNKTDDEIILYTKYDYTVEINVLLYNSKTTRRSKTNPNQPPRPQNAFMLYRRDKAAKHKQEFKEKELKQDEISIEIASMWKDETLEVKELFRALGRMSEKLHLEDHGSYRYLPKQKNKKNGQRSSQSNSSDSEMTNVSSDIDVPDSPASDNSGNSDMSNISDFSNPDDIIYANTETDLSKLGNNNVNLDTTNYGINNFNKIDNIDVVQQVPPSPVLPVPALTPPEQQEFYNIFLLAYDIYMHLKFNANNTNEAVVLETPAEPLVSDNLDQYFNYDDFFFNPMEKKSNFK